MFISSFLLRLKRGTATSEFATDRHPASHARDSRQITSARSSCCLITVPVLVFARTVKPAPTLLHRRVVNRALRRRLLRAVALTAALSRGRVPLRRLCPDCLQPVNDAPEVARATFALD